MLGSIYFRSIHTSSNRMYLQMLSRIRLVDNSEMATLPYHRPPKVISIHRPQRSKMRGKTGDVMLLAVRGQKVRALCVGMKMPQGTFKPKFDTNNAVLIDEKGNPLGTRITVPIPTSLRRLDRKFGKVLAIAPYFV